jgi:hypothetical protein
LNKRGHRPPGDENLEKLEIPDDFRRLIEYLLSPTPDTRRDFE